MNNQEQYTATAPVITLTASKHADRLAIASFVCGIIGVVTLAFGFVPGFLGYAFYLDAKRRGSSHGLMYAGRVLCIISMAVSLGIIALVTISCGMAFSSMFAALSEVMPK